MLLINVLRQMAKFKQFGLEVSPKGRKMPCTTTLSFALNKGTVGKKTTTTIEK